MLYYKKIFLLFITLIWGISSSLVYSQESRISSYKKQLKEARASQNTKRQVELNKKIASVYLTNDSLNKAEIFFKKAMNSANRSLSVTEKYKLASDIADKFISNELWSAAVEYLDNCMQYCEDLNNKVLKCKGLLKFGNALIQSGEYQRAINRLNESKKIATFEINNDRLARKSYRLLAQAYKAAGNDKKYMKYMRLSEIKEEREEKKEIKERAENLEQKTEQTKQKLNKKLKQLDSLSDSLNISQQIRKRKEYLVQIQKERLKAQEAELKKERILNYALIAGIFILILFSGLWFYQYRQKHKALQKNIEQNKRITEQKDHIEKQANILAQTNKELKKLSIVAREISNSVAIVTADMELEWVNPGFTKIHGYQLDEFYKKFGRKITPNSKDEIFRYDRLKECLTKKTTVQYEGAYLQFDDKRYWTQVTLTPSINQDDEVSRIIIIETDISAIKSLEEFKEKMTHMIIHDLKNPLNTILNISELIEEDYQSKILKVSGEQMLNMVENILDIQKLESDKMPLDITNNYVGDVISNAVEEVKLLVEVSRNNQLTLNYDYPENLGFSFDYENIKRVLVNLLTNAIKYTPEGGKIHVESEEIIQNNSNYVLFSVKDTGHGISEENQKLIFDQYAQIKAKKSGASRSSGLGLTFCKMMVEAHNGFIGVDSEVDKGSNFYFALPRV